MRSRVALLAVLALLAVTFALPASSQAQAGEQVKTFDATYDIQSNGDVKVVEDIGYDFGSNERHGPFRYIPVRYEYDSDRDRKMDIDDVAVTDENGTPYNFEITDRDPNLVLKIGDADVLITGLHHYLISYTLHDSLNPFDDHDEFYWNVTGNDWDVALSAVTAKVTVPGDKNPAPIQKVDCFQGETGSTESCKTKTFSAGTSNFASQGILFQGSGLTIVVGLEKGAVTVGPPNLVDKPENAWVHAFKPNPITIGVALIGAIAALFAIARLWWVQGRDRWLGDMFYLNQPPADPSQEKVKPLMAHESVVVEFAPPELDGESKRPLRPAEIGVLLDERADTLDVTATIVDLAVRKHLTITEEKDGGVFGLFKHKDYVLDRLEPETNDLLPYEQELKDAFFESGSSVKLSSLKNKFHDDLAEVKKTLYKQVMSNRFFPYHPDTVRTVVRVAGIVLGVVGGLAMFGVGTLISGGAYLGLPLLVGGVVLLLAAGAFPRRTATGRVLYRRSLGFRRFMVESDKERQRFAERANIFHEYLPYAIVYGCVDKWAQAFEDLGIEVSQPYYYVGAGPFIVSDFTSNVSSFSSSIGSTMASTPGGSGGSGFSGGSSGGGGGGGGGGSW